MTCTSANVAALSPCMNWSGTAKRGIATNAAGIKRCLLHAGAAQLIMRVSSVHPLDEKPLNPGLLSMNNRTRMHAESSWVEGFLLSSVRAHIDAAYRPMSGLYPYTDGASISTNPGAVAFRSDHQNRQSKPTSRMARVTGRLIVECDVLRAADLFWLAEGSKEPQSMGVSGAYGVCYARNNP